MIVRTFRIFLDLSKSSEIEKIRSLLRYMVGIWSKKCQGRKLVKKVENLKVLRMSLPVVENLSGLQESMLSLSRGPQLYFDEKSKQMSNYIKFIDFPLFPLFGVPWAAVIPCWSCRPWLPHMLVVWCLLLRSWLLSNLSCSYKWAATAPFHFALGMCPERCCPQPHPI